MENKKTGIIPKLIISGSTLLIAGGVFANRDEIKQIFPETKTDKNTENTDGKYTNPTTEQTAEKLIITANTNPNTDGDGKDLEKLSDGGKPSVTFDKNGKIETNTNPHLSTNDVTNFNQIPVNHAILPLVRKYIIEIANDTKIHPTNKLKLERDAILLAHTMYNTEIKRVAVSDFQGRYGEYKENFEDFTSDSQSLTQAWKSITTLADKVANPKKVETTDDEEFDFSEILEEKDNEIKKKKEINAEKDEKIEALEYKKGLIKNGMLEKEADQKMREKYPNVKFNNNWSSKTNAPSVNYENLSFFK